MTSGARNKVMDPSAKGSSMSEAERIKMEIKNKISESKITSIWSEVTDTNVGLWDYEEFKARIAVQNLPLLAKRTLELGLAHVVGFPSTMQCYKLVLKCARHYDRGT